MGHRGMTCFARLWWRSQGWGLSQPQLAVPSVPSACTAVGVCLSTAPGDYPSSCPPVPYNCEGQQHQRNVELLLAAGRNLCCVLSKQTKSAERSRKASLGSWLWHPDLSKTSCVDLGLVRLNGDGDILLQGCKPLQPQISY